jgi:hypothetical protein
VRQGFGDAGTERKPQLGHMVVECRRRETCPHLVDDVKGVVEPDAWKEQQELFAPNPAKAILFPYARAADFRKMPQNGVSGVMAMGVVDGLEPIDVDDRSAEAGAGQLARGKRLIEQFQDMAAVRQAGKGSDREVRRAGSWAWRRDFSWRFRAVMSAPTDSTQPFGRMV